MYHFESYPQLWKHLYNGEGMECCPNVSLNHPSNVLILQVSQYLEKQLVYFLSSLSYSTSYVPLFLISGTPLLSPVQVSASPNQFGCTFPPDPVAGSRCTESAVYKNERAVHFLVWPHRDLHHPQWPAVWSECNCFLDFQNQSRFHPHNSGKK